MQTLDVIPVPESPQQLEEGTDAHPVGEIRLWTTGALARRANALSGGEALALSHDPWETMTWTCRYAGEDV
ncbi:MULTISPECIES: hypothetical protein [unclassified Kitasatospora]|uniref:hypothetical protein n=1 Tax=unclassified Kitasatospora TaxID=2633591 RepID=UPI001ADF315C|nr:hypothetical protein [Kitasatospora sp. RG8]MBP0449127.1 hypothetical protein [Kitasatospora sp. RG8]